MKKYRECEREMIKKNVLIVTESFSLGGLETHILSHCKVLHELGHKIFIATSQNATLNIIDEYVEQSLLIENFSSTKGNDIVQQFKELKSFILKNEIDYLQIHPYTSAIVAASVANFLEIPYSFTAHGPLNFSSVYGETYKSLMFEKVLANAERVYSVSIEVSNLIKEHNKNIKVKVLPNVIEVKELPNTKLDSEKRNVISIISRLDKDKIAGVIESIKFCKKLLKQPFGKGTKILVIGDGDALGELKEFLGDDNDVYLEGYSDDVNNYINRSLFVCGMGRVILETLAQNIPALLIGYDGVKEFVTMENIEELAEVNFSGRNSESKPQQEILNEIHESMLVQDKYLLNSWVYFNRSSKVLLNEYDFLNDITPFKKDNWGIQFLKICEEIQEENVLATANLVYLADLINIDNNKLLMALLHEINRVKQEKHLVEVELGMVKQSLLESSTKNADLDKKYNSIIDNFSDIADEINSKQFDLIEQATKLLNMPNEQELTRIYESLNIKDHEIASLNHQVFSLNNQLAVNNEVFGELSQKTYEIYGSRYFKLVNLLQRLNLHLLKGNKSEKKEFVKWLTKKIKKEHYVSTNKISHPLDQIINVLEKRYGQQNTQLGQTENVTMSISSFDTMYNQKYQYLADYLNQPNVENVNKVKEIINSKDYKGIVVYPQAVHWEPMQRPQHFLRELAKKGYLCFFCAPFENEFIIKEYEENLFIVNEEAVLLAGIKNKFSIVLCTWQGQKPFIDHLPNKLLWYDLLDQLEFFADTDEKTVAAHYEMVKKAEIISYSAEKLYKYLESREDAILLPNASNMTDFLVSNIDRVNSKTLINTKGRKVIGYFGAVEEWFDTDIINTLVTNNKDLLFVVIGHVSPNVQLNKANNLLLLGKVDYNKLVGYASQFDVALIPFKVNDLTNCVSPVKYFEYRALGLPVVTTPIHEMKRYENDYGVFLADNAEAFESSIYEALKINRQNLIETSKDFVMKNQWENRIDAVEKLLENNFNNLKAYANYKPKNHISVMTGTFLGLDGEQFYSGGAERYLIDLHEVALKKNLDLIIYQYGTYPWTRRFKNIEVRSLARGEERMELLSVENVRKYNSVYYEEENANANLNIYSAFFEAWPRPAHPSIGISHGVAWDSVNNKDLSAMTFWEQNRRIIEAAKVVDKIVSVDTNTTNWFQTIDFEIGNKMEYIPNYVDREIFKPGEKNNDRIVISYPRRLYGARGLYLVLDILDEILEKYPNVDFHFVGKGFEEDTKHVEAKIKKWSNRVQWYSLDPSEMHKAYETADISLVPTLHSEGTSLSCLEAMASGNAVISTRIGGLTDLVINNFNGILIEPNSIDLKNAIMKLLDSPRMLKNIQQNAIEVSKVFSKTQWSEKWSQIISPYIDSIDNDEVISPLKTLHYYVDDKNDLNRFQNRILNDLLNGDTVMIFMKKILEKREKFSFGRLQFLTFEEDVFDAGEYAMASNKLKDSLINYKYPINEFI